MAENYKINAKINAKVKIDKVCSMQEHEVEGTENGQEKQVVHIEQEDYRK